jgi:FlaA1/EpsC-like NDP-sugar epimerase
MQFLASDFFASRSSGNRKNLLIIGAGRTGEKIRREFGDNSGLKYNVIGFLDDDSTKVGMYIHGTPVLGTVDELNRIVEEKAISEVIIAISNATSAEMRHIVELCEGTGLKFRTVPSIGELIDGKVSIKSIRDVSFSDLLGRPTVELTEGAIREYLTNKRILITGAAGSIGSELCRQVSQFQPQSLILLDRSESPLYEIEMELKQSFPAMRYEVVLGAIQNEDQLRGVFDEYKPQAVFHAAAYKHVPMIELNPWEAVFNNIVGTRNVLRMCQLSGEGVERFVLISTDKAVRPTNVMGASKRVAEIMTQLSSGICPQTKQMVVRFGNVIGSSGSVIPLFIKQIARGGPISVTHPDVTRYFMTIPEASQLVLQAGAMGNGGEIFILDMGNPLKIMDVAKDLIRLSGLEPGIDIEIQVVGLRPGEKLYEELIIKGEGITSTDHKKIMVLRDSLTHCDSTIEKWNELNEEVNQLMTLAKERDSRGIMIKLKEIVPEYTPSLSGD